jgi:TonB family protein
MSILLSLLLCLSSPGATSNHRNESPSFATNQLQRLKVDDLRKRVISCVSPQLAGNIDASGTVFVAVLIGDDGSVRSAKPLSGASIISQPAVEAVKKWKFKPLTAKGKAQPFSGVLPIYVGWKTEEMERNCSDNDEAAIRAVLDAQAAAWNRGDVDGYMDGYDRSPNTEFVSGDTITRGWQQVLDRYKQRYDTRDKMGGLTFSDLKITVLSNDAALVLGRWRLQRVTSPSLRTNGEPHGTFTLLFRKTKAGWRIVHDHTSSA